MLSGGLALLVSYIPLAQRSSGKGTGFALRGRYSPWLIAEGTIARHRTRTPPMDPTAGVGRVPLGLERFGAAGLVEGISVPPPIPPARSLRILGPRQHRPRLCPAAAGATPIKTSLQQKRHSKGALLARERSPPARGPLLPSPRGPFKLSHDSKLLSLRYERQQSSREQLTVQDARYLTYVLP